MTSTLIKSLLVILWGYNLGKLCQDVNEREYVYVSTPMSLNEAAAYCVSTYNQHLATIITENDMINAVSTIITENVSDVAWIGMRSVHKSGWFEYFDDVECPPETEPYGSCLGKEFWAEGKPVGCCNKCVTLYAQSNASGQINNDIECEETQPFLCNAPVRKYTNTGLTGNWDEAYNYCLNRGGLASFQNERDLKNLEKVIDETNSDYAWIGLVQHSDEQNWYWMDDTECTLTNDLCTDLWSDGEPNGLPGHVSCECKSYGCIREGCLQNGCKQNGCRENGCIKSQCRKECERYKESVLCDNGHHSPNCCLKWKNICTGCLEWGCVDYGCVDYGCINYGCVENGCIDYNCVTEDADCAAVQSDSGLAADYHCTTNIGAIICNDYSMISYPQIVSDSYLFEDLFEPKNSSEINILRLLNNNVFSVLLAISCMINIYLCGWYRHKRSKVKYESVDVEEMEKIDVYK
eukprot:415094_1